ncbi:hybrid sensor histidine kinase/response regulator [Desulfovibrio ferrophilus]|uniref:histidine kinase n=1 Tax=Desulfovibrio ferrophilus TaxID=241368 RepID=A0A2Z6AW28_9BACT|nr:hybrid sensor histidine kinase/response regulator [Desulfovibrio ferrophilus]BBD07396.1 two-component hybrid sensor and regulator [Desulfovibrio ferrophilus]
MASESKPRLLLVDDTPANLRILSDALRDRYSLMVATSGQAALEIAQGDEQPDMILLDIMMPEMDGYEVCERLKADDSTADIPVIFVTAMQDVQDETRGLAMGAADYITKPFNLDVVRARVKTHLSLLMARRRVEEQNRELVKASELREEVDRITRHDLKNPLTNVISVPQLMLMADNLEDHQREMLERVEESGLSMLSMINFSLDLFKMEQGTYTLQPEPVDLVLLAKRVFRELNELAGSREAKLSLEMDGTPPGEGVVFEVMGEELLVYSMLGNLVRNALEASAVGDDVVVRLESADPARMVIHNPRAVPSEIRDRFFDKYVTHGKRQGTGLGTYSAKLSAKTLGGAISLESEDGRGTTVTVSLPVA